MELFDTIMQSDFVGQYIDDFKDDRAEEIAYLCSEQYLADVERLKNGEYFITPPEQLLIPKKGGKYRKVYKYPANIRTLLGIINYAMHRYDDRFPECCYSHLKKRGLIKLYLAVVRNNELVDCCAYASDISSFGDSVDRDILNQDIDDFLTDDPSLNRFLHQNVNDTRYYIGDTLCHDGIALKSGNPLTAFFEDLFLLKFDLEMMKRTAYYFRYSDDFFFYCRDMDSLLSAAKFCEEYLTNSKLSINSGKTCIAPKGEAFNTMDYSIRGNIITRIDYIEYLKQAIAEKKKKALQFKRRYALSGQEAMAWFLKTLHYSDKDKVQMCVKSLINAAEAYELDNYIQDALRQVGSGKKSNAKYRIRYEDMKKAGYHSLVNEYYRLYGGK